MAIGLLGSFKATSNGNFTVYTVPSGISHAVTHITLSSEQGGGSGAGSFAAVNGVQILRIASGSAADAISNASVSMMLSPGNVVSVDNNSGGGTAVSVTVSGYTVA